MSEELEIQSMPYEDAFEQLEEMVSLPESGNLALEDALKAFEKGQEAARRCSVLLEDAEITLKKLVPDEDGTYVEEEWKADSSN